MQLVKEGVALLIMVATAVGIFLLLVAVTASTGYTQNVDAIQDECLRPEFLEGACGLEYRPGCPNLGIPKSWYGEVKNHLPMNGECLARPLSYHHSIVAYRNQWIDKSSRLDVCLNNFAQLSRIIQDGWEKEARLRKACGSKCKRVK